MIHTIQVGHAYDVENARRSALRSCVIYNVRLHDEFREKYPLNDNDIDGFIKQISNFIKEKGLRIISETPSVYIEDDRYKVRVDYLIEEPNQGELV